MRWFLECGILPGSQRFQMSFFIQILKIHSSKKSSPHLHQACITDKIPEARLRWYGHVMRREDKNCMKRIMTAEVNGRCSRGRQKKRWEDTIQQDMKSLRLKKEQTDQFKQEGDIYQQRLLLMKLFKSSLNPK